MDVLLRENLAKIHALCGRFHVAQLWVFGSASGAAEHFDASSDIDFVVEIDRTSRAGRGLSDPFWQLTIALEELLGRRIQLLELADVRKPALRDAILRQRELIYDSSRAVAAS